MFFGEGLKGSGFVGEHGSLAADDLYNERDLQWHTDFKQVYATVLKEWMCVDRAIVDATVLDSEYESLDLGFVCSSTLSNGSFTEKIEAFSSQVIYDMGNTYIKLHNNITQHVVINLYDLNGRNLGQINNSMLSAGTHSFDIKSKLKMDLSRGYYIYTISSNSKTVNKKLMII